MARLRLNGAGLQRAIRTPAMQRALLDAGEAVATNVEAQGIKVGDHDGRPHEIPLPVGVYDNVNGYPSAAVVLNHPSGLAVQAKHGALTKAAAEAGLRVTGGSE